MSSFLPSVPSRRARIALSVAALAAYAVLFVPLSARIGPGAASLVMIPAMLSGLLLGWRGGVACGIASWPVNHALVAFAEGDPALVAHASEAYHVVLAVIAGGVVGGLSDMTVRLRAAVDGEKQARLQAESIEKVLRASDDRLRGLIEGAPETVIITDRVGNVTFTGGAPGPRPALGAAVLDWAGPRARARTADALAAAVGGGETKRFVVMPEAGSDSRYYAVSIGPVRGPTGVEGALFLVTDVTDRKLADRALREAERQAALATLMAGVAHEINNPLTYVRGTLELAALELEDAVRDGSPERLRATVDEIRANVPTLTRGVDRIAHITQSLRRISQQNEGGRERAHLNGLVEGVLAVVESRAPVGLAMRADLASASPVHVEPAEVAQVLMNLVVNAVEAVGDSKGGRVFVRTWDEPHAVVFEVEDNGPGVDPSLGESIFSPFLTTKHDGTGLGLSICRRIAEDHGGAITWQSEPGAGATFRLEIPRAAPATAVGWGSSGVA